MKNWVGVLFSFLASVLLAGCTCSKRTVNLFIWSSYTSEESLAEFFKKTGVRVVESNFSSNEELLAKLQAGATGYDLIIPSDYMIGVMQKLNLLKALDLKKIPNAAAINKDLLGKAYDPQNTYSLPYAWGMSGIAYRKSKVKAPLTSWKEVFADPQLAGRISLLDDAREAISVALKQAGKSGANTTRPEDLEEARKIFARLKPAVKSFTSTPMPALLSGDVDVAHMYVNEALMAEDKAQGDIAFAFPTEGGVVAIDNFAIPASAKNVDEAHLLINFLLEKSNHAQFVNRMYVGPVRQDLGPLLSEKMRANIFFSDFAGLAKRADMLEDLGADQQLYDKLWTDIKAM